MFLHTRVLLTTPKKRSVLKVPLGPVSSKVKIWHAGSGNGSLPQSLRTTLLLSAFVSIPNFFRITCLLNSHANTISSEAPVDEEWLLHPILLAGWGTPMGELFDLDALAELCKLKNRWSFFVTSVPLRYKGAVASPPNALAIF